MKRPGYYVEERWFRDNFHQARARAAYLAKEYGRGINLVQVNVDGKAHVLSTIFNGKQEQTA